MGCRMKKKYIENFVKKCDREKNTSRTYCGYSNIESYFLFHHPPAGGDEEMPIPPVGYIR
jgi:hypothetical protein